VTASIPVGLIGTGFAASVYAEALRGVVGLRLVSVAGREAAKASALATTAGADGYTDDTASLMKSKEIDAVILAVPPHAQPHLAMEAFRNGKHVLCEKPLAVALSDAMAVHDAWKRSGRIGMVNFCYRLIPQIAEFKRRIAAGECGELQSLHVEWVLSSRLNRKLTYHWKNQNELGGGALRNYGTHVIDYLFHDEPDVEVCGAVKHVHVKTRPDSNGVEWPATADETVTVLFRMRGSVSATMHLSLVTTPASGHRIIARGSTGTLEVCNPDPRSPAGPFRLRFLTGAESEHEPVGLVTTCEATTAGMFGRVLTGFYESMQNGRTCGLSVEDALRAARLVDTIERAAE